MSEGLQYFKNSDGNAIPQEFSTALQKDLNGCFGSRYNRDASGAPVSHGQYLDRLCRILTCLRASLIDPVRYLVLLQDKTSFH